MSNLFSLESKVAIVTGGSKGIGAAVATVLAEQGAFVHILDIDCDPGQELVSGIIDNGGNAFFHECDLTDHDKVGRIFENVHEEMGRIDILINNAAIASIGTVEDTSEDEMKRLYEVNIKSVYSCLHFAIPWMRKSGGGSIVNLASIASVVGLSERFAYTMSKGAVYSMTFSIAKDYLSDNIRCNAIGPARVHTPFVDGYLQMNYPGREKEMYDVLSKTQPIGRMAKPLEIAYLVAYLCSDEAGFITGSFYPIDGGFLRLNT